MYLTGRFSMFSFSKLTYGLIIALLIALAGAGWQTVRLAKEKQSHAETVAANEKEWALQYKTSADAAKEGLAIYAKQTEALQEESDNAKKQRDKASADAVANAHTGDRLRRELAKERARSCAAKAENTTTPNRSETTGQAGDMFEYVLRRVDEATDTIAEYADAAGIAGTACERSYEKVR